MSILVFLEHHGNELSKASLGVLSKAASLGDAEVGGVIAGSNVRPAEPTGGVVMSGCQRYTSGKRLGGPKVAFVPVRRACLALQVPTNAHLADSGNRWSCDPGYQEQGETCTDDERRAP